MTLSPAGNLGGRPVVSGTWSGWRGVSRVGVAARCRGAYETLPRKRRQRTGPRLSATYVNEITAMFYGTKRTELDYRESWSMMRDEGLRRRAAARGRSGPGDRGSAASDAVTGRVVGERLAAAGAAEVDRLVLVTQVERRGADRHAAYRIRRLEDHISGGRGVVAGRAGAFGDQFRVDRQARSRPGCGRRCPGRPACAPWRAPRRSRSVRGPRHCLAGTGDQPDVRHAGP